MQGANGARSLGEDHDAGFARDARREARARGAARLRTSDRRYLVSDHQGSIIAEAGAGAVRYSYGPYGEPNTWTGSRFRYTGQIALPEIQLYHYKARVYDPVLGRSLQTDPVGYEDDLHLYAYVRNDPLNLNDPTGRQAGSRLPDRETIQERVTNSPIVGARGSVNEADRPGEGSGDYGSRRVTASGTVGRHQGTDFQASEGTSVFATGDGTVVDIQPNPSTTFGNQVVIDHGEGVFSQYSHLQDGSVTVSPGDAVSGGDQIGAVGRTGNVPRAGDSHLHYELRVGGPQPSVAGGQTVNPMDYLPAEIPWSPIGRTIE